MLFVDDNILIDEPHNGVNNIGWRFWRQPLKSKLFLLRRNNTKYLEFKFNDFPYKVGMEVRLDTQAIPKRVIFKICWVFNHIVADFMKWRFSSGF